MEPPHDSQREAKILAMAASERVIPLIETFRENGSHFVLVFPFVRYDFSDLLRGKKLSKSIASTSLSALRDRGLQPSDIRSLLGI